MAEKQLTQQEQARRDKLAKYRELGVDPFGSKFVQDTNSAELKERFANIKKEEDVPQNQKPFKITGRIVLLRKMGKASFFHIRDRYGDIQAYIKQDNVGEENYSIFRLADLGDICGLEGTAMVTQTGELTIRVDHYYHLTKALKPLPEKFHGLTDVEERYRRRYVDLIMNADARKTAFLRPLIVKEIRKFLDERNFVEVETPALHPILGGANARPFITHHNTLDKDFYLRIATELSLKRLIVGGMERVFEIGKCFRNEGMDLTHNPEFTSMELYQAYANLDDMVELTETMFRHLAKTIRGTYKIHWMGYDVDLEPEFKKASMCELINEYCGVDFTKVQSLEEALELANKYDVPVEKHFLFGHVINAFFEKFCKEHLVQPTFVTGHPLDISPLAKKNPQDPRFTERFELYICKKEMCNAFTELNDPIDQYQRFLAQAEEKKKGNDEACEIDDDFVEALEYGLPPTGGIGYGIDRLVMFLTSNDSIREVILFPTMKPNNK